MEDLFSFLVPILGVIAWIVGSMNNKEEEKTKPSRPTVSKEQQEVQQPDIILSENTNGNEEVSTFAQQKREQLEKIQSNLDKAASIRNNQTTFNSKTLKRPSKSKSKKKRLALSSSLTKEGVAKSVLMAEILGPPKAYRKK